MANRLLTQKESSDSITEAMKSVCSKHPDKYEFRDGAIHIKEINRTETNLSLLQKNNKIKLKQYGST